MIPVLLKHWVLVQGDLHLLIPPLGRHFLYGIGEHWFFSPVVQGCSKTFDYILATFTVPHVTVLCMSYVCPEAELLPLSQGHQFL